jgi:hypothetical protein
MLLSFLGADIDAKLTKVSGIEAGAEVNNISDANATDLTDSGDTALHYHSTDRNRANHTGTQTAATISDFDTEVSNNSDVTVNTAARHDAVTLGTANGLSLSSQELSLDTATASTAGAMSADDKINLADTQVKTARNADSISNLQTVVQSLNPNNADKITQTMYGTAASLPITAGGGGLGVTIKGNTVTNLAPFAGCESTSGWSTSVVTIALDTANKYEGTYCYKVTNSGGTSGAAYRNILTGSGARLDVNCVGGSGSKYSDAVVATAYARVGIILQPSDMATATTINVYERTSGAETEYGYFDAIMVNEISAEDYALGVSTCLAKYKYIPYGTANVGPQRVTAIGENIFDINHYKAAPVATPVGYYAKAINLNLGQFNIVSNVVVKNALPSGTYIYISDTVNPNDSPYGLDGLIGIANNGTVFASKTTFNTDNAKFRYLSVYNTTQSIKEEVLTNLDYYLDIMLSYGTIATIYEDYTDTKAYYPAIGNSVPNGVADEVNNLTDKRMQNAQEYTLQASDITAISDAYEGVTRATCALPSNSYSFSANTVGGVYIVGKNEVIANASSYVPANIGNYTTYLQNIYFVLDDGTSLAAAQVALTGTKIWYQLAEPIVTGNVVSGALVSHSKGSVYIDPAISGAEIYSTGISIADTDWPISEIESISKVDPATGALTAIDVSTAVIASGGLSFTHPDLTNGDLVEYVYLYDEALTVYGVTDLEYYDSRTIIADTANGKYYKWQIASTNGVASTTLTEVN